MPNAVSFRMEKSKEIQRDEFDEFVQAHIHRWSDVKKLLVALGKKFPHRLYPNTAQSDTNKVLKNVETFIDIASGNRTKELLVDLLKGRGRRSLHECGDKSCSR